MVERDVETHSMIRIIERSMTQRNSCPQKNKRCMPIASCLPALDDMVKRDVEADLQDIRRPLPCTSVSPDIVEKTLTQSQILKTKGFQFAQIEPEIWTLTYGKYTYQVTFSPQIFEERPSLRLLLWGDPLFTEIVSAFTSVN